MSYLIAYVSYQEDGTDYPVNCLRTDLRVGDKVIVRQNSDGGKLKTAKVTKVEYLNWKCANTIECLLSEATTPQGALELPPNTPVVFGIARPYDAWVELYKSGWIRCKTTNRQFHAIFTYTNKTQFANIFFRMNAIDIQIRDNSERSSYLAPGVFDAHGRNGVRHFLSQSGINLLEHVLSFADAFTHDSNDYSAFMVPIGSRNRSTDTLKSRVGKGREESFEATLYDVLGGSGESVYVGDGMWLSSGGTWSDDGR